MNRVLIDSYWFNAFYTLPYQSKAWMVSSMHTAIPNCPMVLSFDLFVTGRMVLGMDFLEP